jgi:hypothetical protein
MQWPFTIFDLNAALKRLALSGLALSGLALSGVEESKGN